MGCHDLIENALIRRMGSQVRRVQFQLFIKINQGFFHKEVVASTCIWIIRGFFFQSSNQPGSEQISFGIIQPVFD